MPVNKRCLDAVSWNTSRLDGFGIGSSDAVVYHQSWDGANSRSDWLPLGGETRNPPTVVSSQPGHLDVFYRGIDRRVYTRHLHDDQWYEWEDLAGGVSSSLTAVSWGPAHVDVFALAGSQGQVPYVKTMNDGTWGTKWVRLDGTFKSELAAVSWAAGRIDIFAVGLDDAIWQRSYDGGKWLDTWESLGGQFISPPSAVSFAEGRLDIFGLTPTGSISYKTYAGSTWSAEWQDLGSGFNSSVSAFATPSPGGSINIFALGTNDAYYRRTYLDGGWSSWEYHGVNFDTAPKAVGRATGRLDIFGLGKYGYASAWHQAYDDATGWQPSFKDWEFDGGSFQKFA